MRIAFSVSKREREIKVHDGRKKRACLNTFARPINKLGRVMPLFWPSGLPSSDAAAFAQPDAAAGELEISAKWPGGTGAVVQSSLAVYRFTANLIARLS